MSNMSYCRFENTLHDLLDCQANIFDDHGDVPKDLSLMEKECRLQLIKVCKQIVNDFQDDDDDDDDDSRDVHGDRNLEREEN